MWRVLLVSFATAAASAHAQSIAGVVVGVSDGDTINLLDSDHRQHKIRLAGIDAPEKRQPFGERSKQHLSSLVLGKQITLDCNKVDRYRREVCVVIIDGRDANLAQVAAGLAWWYRKYAREQSAQQRADYEAAEDSARFSRLGLWIEPDPVPPWEWRHR